MKRILVLVLALIVAVGSLAVPSYAAEIDSGEWIELLDYGQVTDSGNFFSFNSYKKVTLTTPQTSLLYSADILFYLANSTLSSIRIEWGGTTQELNVISLGNNMYRAYGDLKVRNYSDFNIEFLTSGVTNANIFSCKVSQVPVSNFGMNVAGYVYAGGIWKDLSYVADQQGVFVDIPLGNSDTWDFSSGIRLDGWKAYDFIELHLSLTGVASITSVSASMVSSDGDPLAYSVPIDCSYINNSFYNDGAYEILLRLDLRSLDRTVEYFPLLEIYGEHNSTTLSFGIYGAVGYIFADTESSSDYYLRKIYASVVSGFASVGQWFESLGSAVSSGFNSVVGSITDGFDSVLQFWSVDFWNGLVQQYQLIKNIMSSGFQSLLNALNSSGDNQGFNDDVGQQGDKLDDMQDVMDSVTKPALDSIDTNLSGIVTSTDTANIAHVYTMVIGEGPMVSIMTMVVVMAMMSFVLFGKR